MKFMKTTSGRRVLFLDAFHTRREVMFRLQTMAPKNTVAACTAKKASRIHWGAKHGFHTEIRKKRPEHTLSGRCIQLLAYKGCRIRFRPSSCQKETANAQKFIALCCRRLRAAFSRPPAPQYSTCTGICNSFSSLSANLSPQLSSALWQIKCFIFSSCSSDSSRRNSFHSCSAQRSHSPVHP